VQAPVHKAIDWLINKAVGLVKAAGKFLGFGKDKKNAGKADGRSSEEKNQVLHTAIEEALSIARRGVTRQALDQALPEIAQRHGLRSLQTVDHGEESYRIHGELNPTEDSKDLPKVLKVEQAVADIRRKLASRKDKIEISVATLEEARAVIAQAFPVAQEMPSPTPGSAYQSQVDTRNLQEFREFRKKALAFHVDVQRYRVSEIRSRLMQEIREVTELRDHAHKEMQYHRSNPEWAARNEGHLRVSERNFNEHSERWKNLTDIFNNLSQHEEQWKKLEREGVLYGHATVDPDESHHRTNPHVNVEGRTQVETRTEKFEFSIKVAIYVRRTQG
jgi:hypothetical protein